MHFISFLNATDDLCSCPSPPDTLEPKIPKTKTNSVQFSTLVPIVLVAIAIAIIVLLVLALLAKKFASARREPNPWPFYAKKPLTQPEQVLYWRLVKTLPDHMVLAQVQVASVLGVKRGFKFHEWNNRINRMSYDFVICKKDGSVVAAIELDDKTHDSAKRAETDAKKQQATEAAGLILVRWSVAKMPDEVTIRGFA
jgi:hypothetical protein